MIGVLFGAALIADERDLETYPTPEVIVTRIPRLQGGFRVIALGSPAETPPAGAVGYWSDGAQRVAVVTLSSLGRRLFVEYDADVIRTNIARFLYDNELD